MVDKKITEDDSGELRIIRIAGTDIYGDKKIVQGLIRIKGVSHSFANAITKTLNIDKSKKFGDLSEEEIKKINELLENPTQYELPSWMFNRRKDFETGEDVHIMGPDIILSKKMDIKRLQMIRARRGIRHSKGLKVRGQRLRTNARKGKSVGVKRRKGAKTGK